MRNQTRKSQNSSLRLAGFILDGMHISLQRLQTSVPQKVVPFGAGLRTLSESVLADAVVVHRLTKAYERSENTRNSQRKVESIESVLKHDLEGFSFYSQWSSLDPQSRGALLRARLILRDLTRTAKPTYSLVFPTGEGFTSSHGQKDLYYKLSDTRYWQCSHGSFEYVATIFYKNVHMRRLVKSKYYETMLSMHPAYTRRRAAMFLWNKHSHHHGKRDFGFTCFKSMLAVNVDLIDVSRMTTVPKTTKVDRVITCEPFLTMIAQLSYMRDLRNSLRMSTGIDLECLQDWHKAKLRLGHQTIDLKGASDAVWNEVVKWFFPSRVNHVLQQLRTGVTQVGEGEYHHFNMFSPMGCGLTFDVMTLLLTALARAFEPRATVFGDDIMMVHSGEALVELLPKVGLRVNHDKTFLEGNFRESCGAFADLASDVLITCYELRRPTNMVEVVVACNKLHAIITAKQVSAPVMHILLTTWESLTRIIPSDAKVGDDQVQGAVTGVTGVQVWSKDWQRMVDATRTYSLKRPTAQPRNDGALATVRMLRLREPQIYSGAPAQCVRLSLPTESQ